MHMSKTFIVPAVACYVFALAGCAGSGAAALQFNNAIAGANSKLAAAGTSFGVALGPILQGQPGDPAEIRRQFDSVLQQLAAVQADMKALKVPDSQVAKDFWNAHQQFLAGQEKMVKQEFKQIVDIVEGTTPAISKPAEIASVLQRVSGAETADLAKVQAAQKTFCKHYNIRLQ